MDSHGQNLTYVYGHLDPRDAETAKGLPLDEARRIAANIAKLPNLLRRAEKAANLGVLTLLSPRQFLDQFVLPCVKCWERDPLNVRIAVIAISQIDILADQLILHQHPDFTCDQVTKLRKAMEQNSPIRLLVRDVHDTHKHGPLQRATATITTGERPKLVHKPIKGTHEGNPCPERVSPNGATSVGCKKENEEGIQGEPLERPSPNVNPRVEPNVRERLKVVGGTDLYSLLNSDAEDTASAEAAVEEDLRRHGEMYQRVLGWHELESKLAEAAASERREKGSGAKLILARFAERKATGT